MAEPAASIPTVASNAHAVLSANGLVVRYGPHTILDGATVAINEGERVGLVGRNGTGKSTFLRLAAGVADPDAGEVTRRRELVTGFLPQDFQLDNAATVHANILDGARAVLDLIEQYETLPGEDPRSGEALDHITRLDGWNLEHRVGSLIDHLGAPAADRLAGELSGGEKRRVALCRALLARPDFLILDEPTNHLDTESIEWLEEFLRRYPGTCLFVTHDRYFLDRITTRIVELAEGRFWSHPGNYTAFLEAKATRQAANESTEARRQKFLKSELEWVRRGPRARRTKSRDRIDNYYAVAAQDAPEEELDVDLIIPPAPKLADRVIELVNVGVDLGGRTLFDAVNFDVQPGARLGIVGRNGLGKTTLLRVMLGELPPTRGEVRLGTRTQINYVDQGRLRLDDGKTVFEEVGEGTEWVKLGDVETIGLRGYLRRFLFTDERVNTKIAQLSGGERSRVLLAKILKRGGNVIVLDEPTNDLDLATLRVLEEALLGFTGCVLAVSHDRFFLNRVCTSILSFEGAGRLFHDAGNYDDYLAKRAARLQSASTSAAAWKRAAATAAPPAPAATKTPTAAAGNARKLSWKERQEVEAMEATILAAEEEVARLETEFGSPDFYERHGSDWREVEKQLEAARHRVARLYARWEELEKLQRAQG